MTDATRARRSGLTDEDLVNVAAAARFEVSLRTVRDWESRGLLESPPRGRGLGRGRGQAKKRWSDEQLALWIALLVLRDKNRRKTTADLCNVPVAMWLLGQEETVQLPQVRRALRTWAVAFQRPTARQADRWARDIVNVLAVPGAEVGARRAARQILAAWLRGDRMQSATVRHAISGVLGRRGRGLPGLPIETASVSRVLRALRLEPDRVAEIDDETYLEARANQARTLRVMAERWEELQGSPDFGALLGEVTSESEIVQACMYLLLQLGFLVDASRHRSGRPAGEEAGPRSRP